MHEQEFEEHCHLLSGWYATLIQGLIASLCILVLVIKRYTEVPRRDFVVWFLDVAKQSFGSSLSHISNIFLSIIIARNISDSDECQWYILAYMADSVLGSMINFSLLSIFERKMKHHQIEYLQLGNYGNPPRITSWLLQLGVWTSIVLIGKIVVLCILIQFMIPFNSGLQKVFIIFSGHPKLELFVVMILIPMILNVLQFWITDTCLKRVELPRSQGDAYDHLPLTELDLDEILLEEECSGIEIPNKNSVKSMSNRNIFPRRQ